MEATGRIFSRSRENPGDHFLNDPGGPKACLPGAETDRKIKRYAEAVHHQCAPPSAYGARASKRPDPSFSTSILGRARDRSGSTGRPRWAAVLVRTYAVLPHLPEPRAAAFPGLRMGREGASARSTCGNATVLAVRFHNWTAQCVGPPNIGNRAVQTQSRARDCSPGAPPSSQFCSGKPTAPSGNLIYASQSGDFA